MLLTKITKKSIVLRFSSRCTGREKTQHPFLTEGMILVLILLHVKAMVGTKVSGILLLLM